MVQSSSVTPASMVRAIWEGTGGQPLQKARPSPRSLAVQLPTSTTRPPRQSSSVASETQGQSAFVRAQPRISSSVRDRS